MCLIIDPHIHIKRKVIKMKSRLMSYLCLLCFLSFLCWGNASRAENTVQTQTLTSGNYEYIVLPDGTAEIVNCLDKENRGTIIIPSKLDKYKVSSIGTRAFELAWASGLSIPEGIERIGDEAFWGGDYVGEVTIPASVKEIGSNPFMMCDDITRIKVSSDNDNFAEIDGVLYQKKEKKLVSYPGGNARKQFGIPDGIEIIGANALRDCDNLQNISIPNSVVLIKENAFRESEGITSVEIPDSVTNIGEGAFGSCKALTYVKLSSSIKDIEKDVLSWTLISQIDIPKDIETIKDGAWEFRPT